MKKYLAILVLALSANCAFAQGTSSSKSNFQPLFQGYITADAALVGKYPSELLSDLMLNAPGVNVALGAKFGKWLFVGGETGYNFSINTVGNQSVWNPLIPIGANIRGYLPVGRKTSLYLAFSTGAAIFCANPQYNTQTSHSTTTVTAYVNPCVGIETGRFVFSIGYKAFVKQAPAALNCLDVKIGVRIGRNNY